MAEPAKPLIYQSMVAIMQMIEPIRKEKINQQQKFKYRGIDDVMNALHNAFAENGVFIMSEILERSEVERKSAGGGNLFYVTSKICFTFIAIDGSSVSSIICATAMDSGDKADNKVLSIGMKYALLQAFLIPTEEMIDPDAESHQTEPKATETKPEPKRTMDAGRFQKFTIYIQDGDDDADRYNRSILTTLNNFDFSADQKEYLNSILPEPFKNK